MPTLKLTEEDQALLVLLSPEQRDTVLLSLFRGEVAGELTEGAMMIYCGIRRRERERLMTNERGRRRDQKKRENYREIDREKHRDNHAQSHAPSAPSPSAPLVPPSLPPTPPITPPYNPPTTPTSPPPRPPRAGEPKVQLAEFVAMTNAEHKKLLDTHGPADTQRLIEILDNYKGSSGKKYKSDYRAILSWAVDRLREEKAKGACVPKAPSPAYGSQGEADQRAKDDMERMRRIMQEGKL